MQIASPYLYSECLLPINNPVPHGWHRIRGRDIVLRKKIEELISPELATAYHRSYNSK